MSSSGDTLSSGLSLNDDQSGKVRNRPRHRPPQACLFGFSLLAACEMICLFEQIFRKVHRLDHAGSLSTACSDGFGTESTKGGPIRQD